MVLNLLTKREKDINMKAKLIKLEDGEYDLLVESNLEELKNTKLSLKNCQAIERGYDLDELAIKSASTYEDLTSSTFMAGHYDGFKVGFQKALELMKHRLSEETEWDVEIVEECLDKNCDGINKKGECITTGKPKLDKEGCLTLKKL